MINAQMERIKDGISNGADIQYFMDIYNNIWHLVRWHAMTLQNDVFYRGRIANKTRLFSNANELKYPPRGIVKQPGRLNDAGESIAYLTTSTLCTLAELNVDYYQIFCEAEIAYNPKNIVFFSIGVKGDYKGVAEQEDIFIDFFNHLLTTPNKSYYNATFAFAHKMFNSGSIINSNKQDIGIVYNSAQEGKTNQHLHNIAVQPHVFDRSFSITKAIYRIMSYNKKEGNIILNDINSGTILKDGSMAWERSFERMMEYCNDMFGNDAFLVHDENGQGAIIKYPEGSGRIIDTDDTFYHVGFKNHGLTKIEINICK